MKENFDLIWGLFSDTAVAPTKREEDGGWDIYEDALYRIGIYKYTLKSGQTKRFDTNLGYVIPKGYTAIVKERSSMGKISMFIGAGVLDSGYRNQCGIFITNASKEDIEINMLNEDGSRKAIAQILFVKTEHKENPKVVSGVTPELFSKMYPSDRGLGREGSSGK